MKQEPNNGIKHEDSYYKILSTTKSIKLMHESNQTHLALWFFMKLGPWLRNSVVSPNNGHPIVPGGSPFLRYLSSFHFNRPLQTSKNANNKPRKYPKITISLFIQRSIQPTQMIQIWGGLFMPLNSITYACLYIEPQTKFCLGPGPNKILICSPR